jgi:hypothetical protein
MTPFPLVPSGRGRRGHSRNRPCGPISTVAAFWPACCSRLDGWPPYQPLRWVAPHHSWVLGAWSWGVGPVGGRFRPSDGGHIGRGRDGATSVFRRTDGTGGGNRVGGAASLRPSRAAPSVSAPALLAPRRVCPLAPITLPLGRPDFAPISMGGPNLPNASSILERTRGRNTFAGVAHDLIGLPPVGHTTLRFLGINETQAVDFRRHWSEQARYEQKTESQAKRLYEAITDSKDGVLQWIQTHW